MTLKPYSVVVLLIASLALPAFGSNVEKKPARVIEVCDALLKQQGDVLRRLNVDVEDMSEVLLSRLHYDRAWAFSLKEWVISNNNPHLRYRAHFDWHTGEGVLISIQDIQETKTNPYGIKVKMTLFSESPRFVEENYKPENISILAEKIKNDHKSMEETFAFSIDSQGNLRRERNEREIAQIKAMQERNNSSISSIRQDKSHPMVDPDAFQ